MISFRRVVRAAPGAAREAHFLLHSGLRAYVVRTDGVVVDKRLFAGTRVAHSPRLRHVAQIVVAGRMRLAHAGRERWLEPGDVSLQAHDYGDERWEGGPGDGRFEAVVVEWTPAWAAGRVDGWTTGRLTARELARIAGWGAALAGAADEPSPDRATAHTAGLLAMLASAGLPVEPAPAGALAEPVPAAVRRVATALGASLSNLNHRPMLVDLEASLGRCARQLRRAVAAFDRYYDSPTGPSWHRILHWWRLSTAATLMTARGATTKLVADTLGYGSPRAFCLAMDQAGLPSPGRIARTVELLR